MSKKLFLLVFSTLLRNPHIALRYERMNDRAVETDESEDDEKAMVVMTKFKGKCHRCGVYGHKGADCRSNGADGGGNGGNGNGGGGGKVRIICHYCKKPGHKASECRKKKRDQQQGGNNGNGGGSSTEVATPAVVEEEVALLAAKNELQDEDDESENGIGTCPECGCEVHYA